MAEDHDGGAELVEIEFLWSAISGRPVHLLSIISSVSISDHLLRHF